MLKPRTAPHNFSHLFFFFCTFEREIRPTKAELHVESHVGRCCRFSSSPSPYLTINRTHCSSDEMKFSHGTEWELMFSPAGLDALSRFVRDCQQHILSDPMHGRKRRVLINGLDWGMSMMFVLSPAVVQSAEKAWKNNLASRSRSILPRNLDRTTSTFRNFLFSDLPEQTYAITALTSLHPTLRPVRLPKLNVKTSLNAQDKSPSDMVSCYAKSLLALLQPVSTSSVCHKTERTTIHDLIKCQMWSSRAGKQKPECENEITTLEYFQRPLSILASNGRIVFACQVSVCWCFSQLYGYQRTN